MGEARRRKQAATLKNVSNKGLLEVIKNKIIKKFNMNRKDTF
jgi:hypothetical protein